MRKELAVTKEHTTTIDSNTRILLTKFETAEKKTDALMTHVDTIGKGCVMFQEFMQQYKVDNTTPRKKAIQDKTFGTPPQNPPQNPPRSETELTTRDMDESPAKQQELRLRRPYTRTEGNTEAFDKGAKPNSNTNIERGATGSTARKD